MKERYSDVFQLEVKSPFYKVKQSRKVMMIEEALKHNQLFLNHIINYINEVEEVREYTPKEGTTSNNKSKIMTTLKQFYREWCG